MKHNKKYNRGQSEVLGFIFIFSIVILSVGLITVSGAGNLEGLQETAKTDNAENAFVVVSANLKEIHKYNAPSRETELQLSETQLQTENTTTIRVNVQGEGTVQETEIDTITYQTERGDISYDIGTTFREHEENAIMSDKPPFKLSDDHIMIHTVNTNGNFNIGGSSNILLISEKRSDTLHHMDNSGSDVEVEIETSQQRAEEWENYFDENNANTDSSDIDDGIVRAEMSPNNDATVIVRETSIDVSIN